MPDPRRQRVVGLIGCPGAGKTTNAVGSIRWRMGPPNPGRPVASALASETAGVLGRAPRRLGQPGTSAPSRGKGGFHSNDVRGVTATIDPASPLFNVARSPFLVPSTGYEVGLRNRSIAGLETSVALFRLDFASENLFQGDTGTTEPSRPTRRLGIEWTNRYALTPWLRLEGDLTVTNAQFADRDPAGGRVPDAPTVSS